MKRLLLPILATALLTSCANNSASSDTTVAGTDTTVAGPATTVAEPGTTIPENASATTTAPAPSNTFTGTQKELALASINGATYAAVALNSALLQKGGWSSATTTDTATVVQKRSTREAQIVISALQSSPPKGFTVTSYGSEGVVLLYDGSAVQAKNLTGLVEYLEISQKGASVCFRPSTDGNKDGTQMDVSNDGYRSLPVGQLVPPAGSKGWIILLRTSQKAACRLALDTLAAP